LASKFEGKNVDFGITSRWPGDDARMAQIIQTNLFSAVLMGDGRVRIKWDLGKMGLAASVDAGLGSFLFYTLLYGCSILFLFEGLGIQATKSKEKKEA
jgi:hypothetical protein